MAAIAYATRTALPHEGGPLRKAMRDAAPTWGFDPGQFIQLVETASPDYRVRLTFRERRAGEFLVEYLAKRFKSFDARFTPADRDRLADDGALCWSFATEEERRRFVPVLHTVVGIQ
jgi:hypothetical protein